MKAPFAFFKKEILAQLRSGKLLFLTILFVLFGIMNPAVAKMTPWLMELFAESLEQGGMIITQVEVTAMDSWVQFYKNIPMALIAFVLIEGNLFTQEYQSGTLLLSLTKGLARHQVLLAKTSLLVMLWSLGYWLCFGITYGYNAYFWDNSIAQHLMFSVVCWWIFGLWVISLTVLFSTLAKENSIVLVGVGGIALASSLLGFLPKLQKFLPTQLSDGNSLIYGIAEPGKYTPALLVTIAMSLACLIISIPLFNKKQL